MLGQILHCGRYFFHFQGSVRLEFCNFQVGVSPRLLNTGLMLVTCLISWWIVNTAATAMMVPIVQAILTVSVNNSVL